MINRCFAIVSIFSLSLISVIGQQPGLTPQEVAALAAKSPEAQGKKPGFVRIGIAMPTADMGKDFDFSDAPTAVVNTLQVALTDEKIETILLQSALPEREAKQKQCDYAFVSKVTRKKGGGGMFGSMLPMLGAVGASMIPGVGGIVGSIAASTIITTASMSGGFKSKDEVTFEFRVTAADGTALIPTTVTKQKAKKDGEDVLTPQIVQAAKTTLEMIQRQPTTAV